MGSLANHSFRRVTGEAVLFEHNGTSAPLPPGTSSPISQSREIGQAHTDGHCSLYQSNRPIPCHRTHPWAGSTSFSTEVRFRRKICPVLSVNVPSYKTSLLEQNRSGSLLFRQMHVFIGFSLTGAGLHTSSHTAPRVHHPRQRRFLARAFSGHNSRRSSRALSAIAPGAVALSIARRANAAARRSLSRSRS